MNRIRLTVGLQVDGEYIAEPQEAVYDLDVEKRPVVGMITTDGTVVVRLEAVEEAPDA
jgi:hypothetical protein